MNAYIERIRLLIERAPRQAVIGGGAVLLLLLLLLYLQGTFGRKVGPGTVPLATTYAGYQEDTVDRREVQDLINWPATVRSRTVADLAPKVMARVLEMRVEAGAVVRQGDVLAVLDDRELRARAQQAQAALVAVQAQAAQAEADLRRAQALFHKQASTQQELDSAEARTKSMRAQTAQARDALNEVQVALGETTLRAPFDGVVSERLADPGDMAAPGKPLLVVYAPGSLRLETRVSERCVGTLSLGMELPVRIDTPEIESTARLEEIAPAADPQSRTFLVKAALPALPGLRPGTFGSLRAPCGAHTALLIPPAAVTRLGQLESVHVIADGTVQVRNVRTGKSYDGHVEVLSGLQGTERVLVQTKTAERE